MDQNAGRVMSQENALTDSSRPQKTISSGRLTAIDQCVSLSPLRGERVGVRGVSAACVAPSVALSPQGGRGNRCCLPHTWIARPYASSTLSCIISTERRMREDRVHQVFLGGLELHGDDETLDQLRHLRADQVRAQELPGLGIEDGLDQALVLAERDRLAVADEREAADLDLAALLLGRLLGQADAGDLRMAIGAAGDAQLVERMRHAGP